MFRSSLAIFALSLVPLGAQMAFGDELHGFCGTPTVTTCSDNGTITPTSTNPPSFGFWSTGSTMGNFELILMAPNNEVTAPSSYSLSVNGTNVTNTPVTSSLFSTTAFTSGHLSDYLGLNTHPKNPVGAFLPSTQAAQGVTTASGYYVYTFNFGAETGSPNKTGNPPEFSIASGSVPLGSVFLGFEYSCISPTCTSNSIFDKHADIFGYTPNSGAVLEDGMPKTSVPEPASAALVLGALLCAFGIKQVRKSVRG